MKKTSSLIFFAVVAVVLLLLILLETREPDSFMPSTFINGLEFPKEEGYHEDAVVEWWYFAAHLQDVKDPNKLFGATVIFSKDSNHLVSYLIVADIANQKKYTGSDFNSFPVLSTEKLSIKSGENYWITTSPFEYELYYSHQDVVLDLNLKSLKKPMIIEDDIFLGEIVTRSESGGVLGAYWNQTRIDVWGSLTAENKTYNIIGEGWTYRRTFYQSLPLADLGWRWWIVQLDNNTELLFRDISHKESTLSDLFIFDEEAFGTNVERLEQDQYSLKTLKSWTDPRTGQTFPVAWLLEIPGKDVSLEITSLMDDQLLNKTMYEGTCRVEGFYGDVEVRGRAQFEEKKVSP